MPKQDSRIDIRVSKQDKAKFISLAKRLGETVSEIIRRWLHEAISDGQFSGKRDSGNE